MSWKISRGGEIIDPAVAENLVPELCVAADMLHLSLLDFYGENNLDEATIPRSRIVLRIHRRGTEVEPDWEPQVGKGSLAANKWYAWREMAPEMEVVVDALLSPSGRLLENDAEFAIWSIITRHETLSAHARMQLEALRPPIVPNFPNQGVRTISLS